MTSRQPGYGPLPDEYLHDPLDQIAGVRYAVAGEVPGRTVDYVRDAVGNREQMTDNGVTTGYEVNDLNQYTAAGGQALSYSTNGNLVAMPGAAFAYDAQNRLVSAVNGSNSVAFAYDGRNRCVARTVNGATTWMIWNDWSLIEERDAAGAVQATYVHGPRIDEVLARVTDGTVLLYHEDALGSVVALTDAGGTVVEQYRYDVFGQPSVFDATGEPLAASAAGNRFLFTGREWLPELGIYDFRNRAYSPALGRWLQPDPIGFAARDVNLYRYCGASPVVSVDPLGLRTGQIRFYYNPDKFRLGDQQKAETEAIIRDAFNRWGDTRAHELRIQWVEVKDGPCEKDLGRRRDKKTGTTTFHVYLDPTILPLSERADGYNPKGGMMPRVFEGQINHEYPQRMGVVISHEAVWHGVGNCYDWFFDDHDGYVDSRLSAPRDSAGAQFSDEAARIIMKRLEIAK